MAIAFERHRITVDEYHKMAEAGVFHPDARIELIEGELIETLVTMNPPHVSAIGRITRLLVQRLSDRALVLCQTPDILSNYSEPEPDFSIVRFEKREYQDRIPGPADAYFFIEVSFSTHRLDRRKIRVYAKSGVPEAWMVDLVKDCIIVHRDPSPEGYRNVTIAQRGESIAPVAFPDERFLVDDLLPPP